MAKEIMGFQAEVKQLLQLMIHSLYSNKEIFLRELISNASDAADRLRFEAIANTCLYEDNPNLYIRIGYDKVARTITIEDNGIGMSRDDAVSHLGTIARSGTKEFFSRLSGNQKKDAALIGQFGVGFYSGFIVADRITVESRRAGFLTDQGVLWESTGNGEFSVEQIQRAQRGTSITLYLRETEDKLLSFYWLRSIIQKYSDHINLPILMRKEEWDDKKNEMVVKDEDETINQVSALWTRAKSEITNEQYKHFYEYLSHDAEAPLAWTHNHVEGRSEYIQLLYIPSHAPFDIWNRDHRGGLKLYVKRVFITDEAEQLLQNYLRFVKGVVDSSDLPLNVSREILQDSRDVKAIRDGVTKRVLSMLEELADTPDGKQQYKIFWREFGQVFKEGLGEDSVNRELIAKLLRFTSTQTNSAEQNVSLADYISRMKPEQTKIYYVTADSWQGACNSPHLEVFRKKSIEVLLLTDRIDEWMLSFLPEFNGKPLVSVARGDLDLCAVNDETQKAQEKVGEDLKMLIEQMKGVLREKAKDVRLTFRLTDSPSCLVADEGEISGHLQRLLKAAGQKAPDFHPILEINPEHTLIKRLSPDKADFADWCYLLFDQALLAEGGALDDPANFIKRINILLLSGTH
ncbi:molecular chaperone HtpG [Candidatus Vallotia cooleyia]|uniref:molecular chaperone HtpG n=1 Tax=Candidatus Vallotiella adelgis TaxID=1177211 RepID=UPI001D035516|nr:molecular chaperone HtpG [Candidatus Vallotia cooleyia]UDG82412.1 Chaperone protein HtpG [Candidatus Vallotia cooleyia]